MLAYRTRFHCFEAIFTHDSYMGIIGQQSAFGSELVPSVQKSCQHRSINLKIALITLEGSRYILK